jgi:hypothetical protein
MYRLRFIRVLWSPTGTPTLHRPGYGIDAREQVEGSVA